MRTFACACGQRVYFENHRCEACGAALGFDPDAGAVRTLDERSDGVLFARGGGAFRRCANAAAADCNWLVPEGAPAGALCRSCALSRRIPDLDAPENRAPWRAAEAAKRRLLYALLRLRLPFETGGDALVFEILADAAEPEPVLTGHASGLVTLNLAEADPVERARRRAGLGEAYRTLLGHFRHEVGHFYWDALVRDGGRLDAFRARFGDERADYAAAMDRHYTNGPPPDWPAAFVSAYATMHPWEDFAETFAHYLHIVDALDTAAAAGLGVAGAPPIPQDPYRAADMETLVAAWLPLAAAVNSLNRSLGQDDLYPFVLARPAIEKLGFVHDLVAARA